MWKIKMSFSSAVRLSFSRTCRLHQTRIAALRTTQSQRDIPHPLRPLSASPSPSPSTEPPNSSSPPPDPACDWRLVAAVCVQRMPSLGRERSELEVRYQEMRDQVRAEKSRLSDFELEELEHERVRQARIKKALEEDVVDAKTLSGEKTDEFEDLQEMRELELQEFQPASRLTEADRSGDVQSLLRRLDRVLYLLVRKPRQEHAWQMPQGSVEAGESLLQAAGREFTEECGADVKINFYSPAPSAVLSYHHPPLASGLAKSKVFFLKACYLSGVLQLDKEEVVDHVWVTKEEMSEYVSQDYYQAVEPILTE